MGKYCPKCGTEITEGMKFCKQCGAFVETKNEVDNKVLKVQMKKNKASLMVIRVAVVVIALCIIFISKLGSDFGIPDYEKPLKYQIDGINKNNKRKYLSSFSDKTIEYYDKDDLQVSLEDVKKASYQVIKTKKTEMSDLYIPSSLKSAVQNIEDVKIMIIEIEVEMVSGKRIKISKDFNVVKMNGKWYALTNVCDW